MRRLILFISSIALVTLAVTKWPRTPIELSPISMNLSPLQTAIPTQNVFDSKSGALYFFHRHRDKEYGHFHTFLFDEATRRYTHLVGIEIDRCGSPTKVFTTAPWVTGETLTANIDRFVFYDDNPTSAYLQRLIQNLKEPILHAHEHKQSVLKKPHLGRYDIVNFATVSTCTVCGNMSTGCTASTQ